ncbi:peptidyl-prolyl cis-trans isomerase [Actinidia rufa]|uniref:Peptidyl-prolyl cis-trans isomerase n=1 Tax=Actinidia rufa TaxID=165716 RepID=A0A7J0FT26_9ERIC|nr:peptidyl-prolyl cis-trans isomerase [Actinidia rufa]
METRQVISTELARATLRVLVRSPRAKVLPPSRALGEVEYLGSPSPPESSLYMETAPCEILSFTTPTIAGYSPDGNLSNYVSYISEISFHTHPSGDLAGIVGLETEYGTIHIKLLPDCAPHSVAYILELLGLRHCAGCQFYRAEDRGQIWDSKGNHIKDASFGPPFALVQGTLEAQGTTFRKIPTEVCPFIRRGSVAWVGSGPEFFISLANHKEWKKTYTVFGSVLPEDMGIAEKISQLPSKPDVWNNINVSVLEKPVPLWVRKMNKAHGSFNVKGNADAA